MDARAVIFYVDIDIRQNTKLIFRCFPKKPVTSLIDVVAPTFNVDAETWPSYVEAGASESYVNTGTRCGCKIEASRININILCGC